MRLILLGPPGAGKTFTGAHVILDLIKGGKTVGVTAMSHAAISNLIGHDVLPTQGANVYDILRHKELVLSKDAVAALEARLK